MAYVGNLYICRVLFWIIFRSGRGG
jgi:hypothetical protein